MCLDSVPLPDRMFEGPITVSKDKLSLLFHNNSFIKNNSNGHYILHCENTAKKMSLDLELTPLKPPTRQAHDGIVKIGLKQDTMFYYYIPRNACVGQISVNGVTHQVRGDAWYDHEFGGEIKASKRSTPPPTEPASCLSSPTSCASASSTSSASTLQQQPQTSVSEMDGDVVMAAPENKNKGGYAWNWLSCQLHDGSDITATTLVDTKTNHIEDNFAIVTGPAPTGDRVEYPEMTLEPIKSWTSIRTTNDYPTLWKFTIPAAQIELTVESVFDNQEFITLISKPAFWEGRVNVSGTYRGRRVSGKGFIERHGFQAMNSLDRFFKRISKQVMEQIDMVMPLNPNYNQTRDLLADPEFDHFMDGVNIDVFKKTIIQPLREIIDRGGKSWRSFAFLLCIDCVGGNSIKYKHWLAMPEMVRSDRK